MPFRCGFALVVPILLVPSARAAAYAVGADAACTHTTIAAALAAAESHPNADTIRIASNQAYPAQAISFSTAQEVERVGGSADCSQAANGGNHTTLDGSGGAAEPVLRITANTGARITLSYLTIRGGDEEGAGKGGGIYFRGNGSLVLHHATLAQNLAGLGRGIYAEGTGTDAELIFGRNVQIVANTARYNGGGVFNDGVEMTMIEPDSYVAANQAQGVFVPQLNRYVGGLGGGIAVLGDAHSAYTYLGSSGLGSNGAVYLNKARHGGGVALIGRGERAAQLHLFTTDPVRPARISDNEAIVSGGGVYLEGIDEGPGLPNGSPALKAWRAFIQHNIAPRGAAFELATIVNVGDSGAFFNVPSQRPVGALDCPPAAPCGGIVGNAAYDDTGAPVGSIIEAGKLGVVQMRHMTVEGNVGKFLYHSRTENYAVFFDTRHVAITGNTTTSHLFYSEMDESVAQFHFDDTTIAGNSIGADTLLRIRSFDVNPSRLRRSIVWQPGKTILQNGGSPLEYLSNIVSERGSLAGAGSDVILRDPRFVDPAHGDYSLRAASPAVDAAAAVANDARDLHSRPRDRVLGATVAAVFGPRDIGALERQSLYPLVLNGDFNADLRLWQSVTPGTAAFDATQNAIGAAGSGSVKVTRTGLAQGQRAYGLAQCMHLPRAGVYALMGSSYTGPVAALADQPVLEWEFRRSGGEVCNAGPPDRTGSLALARSSVWRGSVQELIAVAAGEWTSDSSIVVRQAVAETSPAVNSTTTAWFDGITLDLVSDTIFRDGFDS